MFVLVALMGMMHVPVVKKIDMALMLDRLVAAFAAMFVAHVVVMDDVVRRKRTPAGKQAQHKQFLDHQLSPFDGCVHGALPYGTPDNMHVVAFPAIRRRADYRPDQRFLIAYSVTLLLAARPS